MENNVTTACKAYIDKVLDGKGPVAPDYIGRFRKENRWYDSVLVIDNARRDVDKENTVYLVLTVGDAKEHHKHCEVIGYANIKTNKIYIFAKKHHIARAVVPGFRDIDGYDKLIHIDGITRTRENEGNLARYYGIDPAFITTVSGPDEKEIDAVEAINAVTNDMEGIPLGLYS